MNGTHSPLSLLTASHADRASVLMHFMIEDFARLDGFLSLGQSKPSAAPSPTSGGPTLDGATRLRLHGLASLLMMTREEIERWYAEYWLAYTVMSAYAHPLHNNGWSFLQMLARLDGLTQRASTLLPRLRIPGIECVEFTTGSLVMRLREDRPRSVRFLHGLLRRLAADFGAKVTLSESPDFGDSAIRVTLTESIPTTSALPAPVRQMRPSTHLPFPPRRDTQPAMAA